MIAGVLEGFAGAPMCGGSVAERKTIIPTKNEAIERLRTVSWGQVGKASTSRST